MLNLDPKTTALVLIDLPRVITSLPLGPRDGAAVVTAAKGLAERFRDAGAPAVAVNVGWAKDGGDALHQPSIVRCPLPPKASSGLQRARRWCRTSLRHPRDKASMGAFYGTDLDVQLRRRGIKAIVSCGIATNIGVESTARQAWKAGYEVVIAEETTSFSAEMHTFAIKTILPLLPA